MTAIYLSSGKQQETDLLTFVMPQARSILCRQLHESDVDDTLQDVLIALLQALRAGRLRNPAALRQYVRTIAQRHAAGRIREYVFARQIEVDIPSDISDPSALCPEDKLEQQQRLTAIATALRNLTPLERDILERFYLLEQTREYISEELGLTNTQFRLIKSRAKAKLNIEYPHETSRRIRKAILSLAEGVNASGLSRR